MSNPYCKRGNDNALRCFSCELDKRRRSKTLNSLTEEEVAKNKKREAAKKRVYEAAKRLDW